VTLTVSGRADRVATVLAAISRADAQRVHRVYKVSTRGSRTSCGCSERRCPSCARVDYQWQTRPGEDEVLAPSRLAQPTPAAAEPEPRAALGPAAAPAQPAEVVSEQRSEIVARVRG